MIALSNFERVEEFNRACGNYPNPWPPKPHEVELRWKLIAEEYQELYNEVWAPEPDPQKVAKELSDLLYVVYGMGDTFNLDVDRIFAEIHRSNMSKMGSDGKPVRRADGKVMKGPDYQPPKLNHIFK